MNRALLAVAICAAILAGSQTSCASDTASV